MGASGGAVAWCAARVPPRSGPVRPRRDGSGRTRRCPRGSAHPVIDDSGGVLRYLCVSAMEHPDVWFHPGGKIAVLTGRAPGGHSPSRRMQVVPAGAEARFRDGEE